MCIRYTRIVRYIPYELVPYQFSALFNALIELHITVLIFLRHKLQHFASLQILTYQIQNFCLKRVPIKTAVFTHI